MKNIIKYIINFWKSDCEKCGEKKCVSFYYEDYFHTKKNVHKCEKCGSNFICL